MRNILNKYLLVIGLSLAVLAGAGVTKVTAQGAGEPVALFLESVDPATNNSVILDQDFQVYVKLRASSNSVNSLYFKINFDNSHLALRRFDIDPNNGLALTSAPVSNSQGYMEFKGTRAFNSNKIITADVTVGTITFSPKIVGKADVSVAILQAGTIDHPLLPTNQPEGPIGSYAIDTARQILKVRVAETQDGLTNPRSPGNSTGYVEYDYTSPPTRVRYSFANTTPGPKTLFACFLDNKGSCQSATATPLLITYSPNPSLSSITCEFDPKGTGTRVTVLGSNFGTHSQQGKGSLNIGGKLGTIADWSEVPIVQTTFPVTVASQSATASSSANQAANQSTSSASTQSRVVATVPDKIDGSQVVLLTLDDGRFVAGTCAVDTSSVSFTATVQCRTPDTLAEKNVRVQIVRDGTSISAYDQKISLDSTGLPQWTGAIPKLEVGKNYNLIIRAPKSVAVKQSFTATTGTTVLDNISLPVGDIFPLTTPDNTINSSDYSELVREWTTTSDTTRAGDFNLDSRVNSLDYSCLVQNFNKTGENFVK